MILLIIELFVGLPLKLLLTIKECILCPGNFFKGD